MHKYVNDKTQFVTKVFASYNAGKHSILQICPPPFEGDNRYRSRSVSQVLTVGVERRLAQTLSAQISICHQSVCIVLTREVSPFCFPVCSTIRVLSLRLAFHCANLPSPFERRSRTIHTGRSNQSDFLAWGRLKELC